VRGTFKGDPRYIIDAHRNSYVDARTGKARWQDHAVFEVIPALAAAGLIAGDVKLNTATSAGLLTVSGLLAAFLFGVMLQVYERAGEWAESAPEPSRDTSDHATNLEEIAANAGYAALVSLCAATAFVVASATSGWPLRIASGIGLALGVHLVLVLLMVMTRLFLLTKTSLDRARVGADRPADIERRRKAS
jgi:hypothetical protein